MHYPQRYDFPHTASQSSNINLISWAVILNPSLYCTVQYSAPILVLYLLSLLSRSFLCLMGGRVILKILCRYLKWTRQVFINPQLIFEKSSLKTNKLIQRLWLSGRSSVLTSQDSRSLLWKCDE